MKCIKSNSTGEVIRVKDVLAAVRVKNGDWVYCPKSEFKKTDVEQDPIKEPIKKTNKKTKRKAKYDNVLKEIEDEQEETETTEEETEES